MKNLLIFSILMLCVLTSVFGTETFLGWRSKNVDAMTKAMAKPANEVPNWMKISYAIDLALAKDPKLVDSYEKMCGIIDETAAKYGMEKSVSNFAKIQLPLCKKMFMREGFEKCKNIPYGINYLAVENAQGVLQMDDADFYATQADMLKRFAKNYSTAREFIILRALENLKRTMSSVDATTADGDLQKIRSAFIVVLNGIKDDKDKAEWKKYITLVEAMLTSTGMVVSTVDNLKSNPEKFNNSLDMEMIKIPAGNFQMGTGEDFNDKPARQVTITKSFYISSCEVTQEQFKKIMGYNPSWYVYKGDKFPVESVSWFEAEEFCQRLSKKEGKTYRLPTEAEWEYACKAGRNWMAAENKDFPPGVLEYAWTPENTDTKPKEVAAKKPNPWGLYDMIGNVFEWCSDWYDDQGYLNAEVVDPKGPHNSCNTLGTGGKVVRGGSSLGGLMNCLSGLVRKFSDVFIHALLLMALLQG